MVERFLRGRAKYFPAQIIDFWMRSPDSVLDTDSNEHELMYATADPPGCIWTEIKSVRPALTAFAVQTVIREVVRGTEHAVKRSSGLHAALTSKDPTRRKKWSDFGSDIFDVVGAVVHKHQQILYNIMRAAAVRPPRMQGETAVVRKSRPPEPVILNAISALNFCRTSRANLLPMSRGLLYFASSASADLIAYNSRLGLSPAYTTIYKSAKFLGIEQGKLSIERGRDPAVVGFGIFDNVQNMHRVRHKRIGQQDVMNVGIAGIFVEAPPSVTVDALDLDDKRMRIKMNLRQHLTVQSFIDWDHRERVRALQFCQTLASLIPELSSIKADIQRAFENDVSILPLPPHKSVIHPLAPNGNKQTIPTELKAGLLDLSAQMGQTPEDHLRRLQLLGGDGMSYSQLLQLKAYLQFHDGEFQSMELVEPPTKILNVVSGIRSTNEMGLIAFD
ncbi:hypothetical protein BDZ89DRAFT_1045133 [Hymenopellis radicata]|nr:hypothetical protein BDZ89DRAFT_1045133 [Hymenopellis radicata]